MPALRAAVGATLSGTPGQPGGFPGITDGAATAPSIVGSQADDAPGPLAHPATWIAAAAAAWLVVLYVHFHTY